MIALESVGPPPQRRRRITLWILRLGIGGFFLAGSAMALVSFSLFGCPCFEGRTARKEPDPGVAAPPLVKPEPAKPIPEDPVK